VCAETFNVPEAALEKYPGWEPKYCREHSPQRKKAQTGAARGFGGNGGRSKGGKGNKGAPGRRPSGSSKEELLTRAEVLAKYQDGPRGPVSSRTAAATRIPGPAVGGWKRKSGPLENLDLVKGLLALHRAHPKCPLEWMRAHDGSRWNEYADSLATATATWRRDVL
jgi:hypothetical protein